jgi:ABC-2 type transport system ATP-binding protein
VVQLVGRVHGVLDVEARRDELVVSTTNGAATISPVAVALAGCGVPVRDLTLRTPTLDDVFLELTGTRFQNDDEETEEVA